MNYPLLSEYIESIKLAEDNFEELKHLRPVLDEDGKPVMSSGNFAVVFKMKDEQTGKLHAVKCFLKEEESRAEAYRMIAEELEPVNSSYLTPIRYLDKELFVDSNVTNETEFPILLMDWVEGQTLDKYIRENIDDQYALEMLAYQFCRLAMWLLPQPFAHGDLKPDNIIVREDGSLVLVDYDGMYVPAMKGQKARELGSPDFRHPSRTADEFNEHIDDFPIASILLSLKAIALQPDLLEEYGAKDRLLFSTSDYCNIENSSLSLAISYLVDESFQSLFVQFKQLIRDNSYTLTLSGSIAKVLRNKLMTISTKFYSSKDFKDSVKDECGVYYSNDGTRLLYISWLQNESYVLGKRTKVICDHAFGDFFHHPCKGVKTVILSKQLVAIGDGAFMGCDIESILLPNSTLFIGEYAFSRCKFLKTIQLPMSVISLGNGTFASCTSLENVTLPGTLEKIPDRLFSNCTSLKSIIIPDSVRSIGEKSFKGCISLEKIIIPEGVISIGEWAFSECSSLKIIELPSTLRHIDKYAFKNCQSIKSIVLPDNIDSLEGNPFVGCQCDIVTKTPHFKFIDKALYTSDMKKIISCLSDCQSFSIPDSVVIIGDSSFMRLPTIQKVYIPDSVVTIEQFAFEKCDNLLEVIHADSIKRIGWAAFSGCGKLTLFRIPSKIEILGEHAFSGCGSLKSVILPKTLLFMGVNPFLYCKCQIINNTLFFKYCNGSLYSSDMKYLISVDNTVSNYNVPKSVISIGEKAFYDSRCTDIILSNNIVHIDEKAFFGAFFLKHIYIPKGTTEKYKKLIKDYNLWNKLVERNTGFFSNLFN